MFNFFLGLIGLGILAYFATISLYSSKYLAKDYGVFAKRQEYEYQHIDPQEKQRGKTVVASDKLENNQELDRYVLPIEQEVIDEKLFRMLESIEGDSSKKTYLKGTLKGLGTEFGILSSKRGGGSNLVITTAGVLLENYSKENKANKYSFRLSEIRLANYINHLNPKKQKQLILSQVCAINNVRGCSATSMIMFKRSQAETDRERLILAASVRFPITEKNQKRLASYANDNCPKQNKNGFNIGDCNFTAQDFQPKGNIEDFRKTGLIVPFCTGLIDTFPQKRLLVDKVQKIVKPINADVELSIFKYSSSEPQSILARCSNNQQIAQHGFNEKMNIASIAKLLVLLSNQDLKDTNIIEAMKTSENKDIQQILNQVSQMQLESEFHRIGIKPNIDKDFAMSISEGLVAMSSNDIHTLLFHLQNVQGQIKRQAMKSALNGTLAYQTSMLNSHLPLRQIIVAKTGTYAMRNNATEENPEGVHGSLVVFTVKHQQELYTIVLRMHSKLPKNSNVIAPICVKANCTRPALKELADASFFIIKQQPKKLVK